MIKLISSIISGCIIASITWITIYIAIKILDYLVNKVNTLLLLYLLLVIILSVIAYFA